MFEDRIQNSRRGTIPLDKGKNNKHVDIRELGEKDGYDKKTSTLKLGIVG